MKRVLGCFFFIIIVFSCARMGSPSGGPKDVAPPIFLQSMPDTLSTNVPITLKEIKINFNEYIVLKEVNKQIIISPPLQNYPIITPGSNAPRKYITLKFEEELLPNTTYNINFGESIEDNTEGNKLPMFSYVFSTGNTIDSLYLKGNILQSLSTKIDLSTTVALYKKDTAMFDFNKKPYYVSKVDSLGGFNFNYLTEGEFKLIAFTDKNYNLKFDEDELLAFQENLVNPKNTTPFTLILSENKSAFKVLSSKQISEGKIEIELKGNPDSITITPLSSTFPKSYYIAHRPYADTASIWFNAKKLNAEKSKERLRFLLTHNKLSDTLQVLYDSKKENKLVLSLDTKETTPNNKIYFSSNNKIDSINANFIKVKKDSVALDFKINYLPEKPDKFSLEFPIKFESDYYIEILPNAIKDMLQQTNDSLRYKIDTKKESDYGNLNLTISNPPKNPFFLQLISNNKIVKTVYGLQTKFEFKFLKPQEYTFRILVDENNNQHWDKADFLNNIQAEKTYLYKESILIRAFWDINETWVLPN